MAEWNRGATPTHTWIVPGIDLSSAAIFVTYRQGGRNVVEHTGSDLTVSYSSPDTTVSTSLTQEESLRFDEGPGEVQLDYVLSTGKRDIGSRDPFIVGKTFKDVVTSVIS